MCGEKPPNQLVGSCVSTDTHVHAEAVLSVLAGFGVGDGQDHH